MDNYLLLLILFAVCLPSMTLDGKVKNVLAVVLAILGFLTVFGGQLITFR